MNQLIVSNCNKTAESSEENISFGGTRARALEQKMRAGWMEGSDVENLLPCVFCSLTLKTDQLFDKMGS